MTTELLHKREVAELLRTSEATISDWVHRNVGVGALSIKLGRRRVWRRSDLEAYLDAEFRKARQKAAS